MTQSAGSKADLPCPKCRSAEVKVALTTDAVVYYRCSGCLHAWAVPVPKPAQIARPAPRRRNIG